MAYDAGSNSWKISGLVFPANTEYKFRMNAGWDLPDAYNLGGEASNLVYGGSNLKDPEGGTYDIELILFRSLSKPLSPGQAMPGSRLCSIHYRPRQLFRPLMEPHR